MLADVNHRMRAEFVGQPAVRRQVVVARRQVRVVVDRDRVLAEATRRLNHHHNVVGLQRGQHDLAVRIA